MPLKVPSTNLLAHNKFAALAEADEGGWPAADDGTSATGPPVSSEAGTEESDEETHTEAQCFDEAEAGAELEELLKVCLSSCPAFSGSVREAASQEIEARIGWLAALEAEHRSPIWKAVVARELLLCEDVLRSWRRTSAAA